MKTLDRIRVEYKGSYRVLTNAEKDVLLEYYSKYDLSLIRVLINQAKSLLEKEKSFIFTRAVQVERQQRNIEAFKQDIGIFEKAWKRVYSREYKARYRKNKVGQESSK